jgi:hypothetical protein
MLWRLLMSSTLLIATARGDAALDRALDAIAPGTAKWATLGIIDAQGHATWMDYRDTGTQLNFWPASSIKLYAVIAALELLTEQGLDVDTTCTFHHRDGQGIWHIDAARTVREMMSEVFKRSSNEDYTLLLRLVGIDRINTQLFTPGRGFPSTALMRGYVKGRPHEYVRSEPQRIRLTSSDGKTQRVIEHTWSGRSYSKDRGCTIIDAEAGNVTSPRELAECLRRVFFHEQLAETERYHLSADQLAALRVGSDGFTGLHMQVASTGPYAWTGAVQQLFPDAKFHHKPGMISNYALDAAYVDAGKVKFILVPVIAAGHASPAPGGEALVGQMAQAMAAWIQSR